MHGKEKITELYAYVVTDTDNTEGVAAFYNPQNGTWMPMVAADYQRVLALRPHAEEVQKLINRPMKLVRFYLREDLEDVK